MDAAEHTDGVNKYLINKNEHSEPVPRLARLLPGPRLGAGGLRWASGMRTWRKEAGLPEGCRPAQGPAKGVETDQGPLTWPHTSAPLTGQSLVATTTLLAPEECAGDNRRAWPATLQLSP